MDWSSLVSNFEGSAGDTSAPAVEYMTEIRQNQVFMLFARSKLELTLLIVEIIFHFHASNLVQKRWLDRSLFRAVNRCKKHGSESCLV